MSEKPQVNSEESVLAAIAGAAAITHGKATEGVSTASTSASTAASKVAMDALSAAQKSSSTASNQKQTENNPQPKVKTQEDITMDNFELFVNGGMSKADFVPCKVKIDSNCRIPLAGGSYRDYKSGQVLQENKLRVSALFEMVKRGLSATALHPKTGVEVIRLSKLPYVGR